MITPIQPANALPGALRPPTAVARAPHSIDSFPIQTPQNPRLNFKTNNFNASTQILDYFFEFRLKVL